MKLAVAGILLIAMPAFADERPVTRPTRDVDVTYVAAIGGQQVRQRTRTVAGAGEIRIDTPTPGFYMILDRGAHTMDMVSDTDRGVVQMPYDPAVGAAGVAGSMDAAAYKRLGAATVAGFSCTEWATTDTAGNQVAACFTGDGVLLRARAGERVLVQAASVTYGRLDPAIFAVPTAYQRAVAPQKR